MKNRRLELAKRNIENIYIYFISHIIKNTTRIIYQMTIEKE